MKNKDARLRTIHWVLETHRLKPVAPRTRYTRFCIAIRTDIRDANLDDMVARLVY